MGRSYSVDLRERVVSFVAAGQSRRGAAARLGTGVGTGVGTGESFAIKLMRRVARTGSLAPAKQGRPAGTGKLASHAAFLIGVVEATPDITMLQLCDRLLAAHEVTVDPAALSRWLCRQGYTYNKSPDGGGARARRRGRSASSLDHATPSEDARPTRAATDDAAHRGDVFVDETAVTTKMVRLRGRALRGKRLPGAAPFGHWHTQIPAYARTGSSSPACAATR